jgi:hypothetical protein
MPTDRYTKIVLTVIAAALVGLLVQNSISPSVAQGGVQRVAICTIDGGKCASVYQDETGYGNPLGLSVVVQND